MKNHIKHDPWCIIEEGFDPKLNRISESIFSIGNGRIGQRANFEETYTGDSLPGAYVAGVYYPDKTKVGWWKTGYPEYFAKVINAANWSAIGVRVDGEELDLANCEVMSFKRVLDMKRGVLERSFKAKMPSGRIVSVVSTRFCSMAHPELAAIRYCITPENFDGRVEFNCSVDFDVQNEDSNYGEKFWDEVERLSIPRKSYIVAKTKKTDFHVCAGMKFNIVQNGVKAYFEAHPYERPKIVGNRVSVLAAKGKETILYKYIGVTSSLYHEKEHLLEYTREIIKAAGEKGFDVLLEEHEAAWKEKWNTCDIAIEGDVAAQQGIRFNIFQLNQTYTGEDERLNIGPKGFTGERYGGSTYWDTEAYCLPFFLSTANPKVAQNLLLYRYKHLPKAIENATKLGIGNGAALYPMVTMNGEESHNEWEVTFEAIHRNGAIAYAIYDYIRYTGDTKYMVEFGLEVLIAIARFWAGRTTWSKARKKYVILGVTGPNEYESNVNNNWYTNYLAVWSLKYAAKSIAEVAKSDKWAWEKLSEAANFDMGELENWEAICKDMFLPEDAKLGIFLQQDNFLDKDLVPVSSLDPAERPLNQHWSWDRILRSGFIKQADVLQGIYFFEEHFSEETIKKNFDFYEQYTVHESSLSPCVHAILAAKLGYEEKSYDMYLRTSRLDLDDYNNDTKDGLHITSMAGTWMSIVKGFGGLRVNDDKLSFSPFIPGKWKSFSFKVCFRGCLMRVDVSQETVSIENLSDEACLLLIYGKEYSLKKRDVMVVNR